MYMPLTNFAEMPFHVGDLDGAIALGRQALAVAREFGTGTGATQGNLAAYLLAAGRIAEAWPIAREGLDLALARDRRMVAAIAIQHLAQIAVRERHVDIGARLIGYVDATYKRERHPREPTERREHERIMAILRQAYAPARLKQLLDLGAELDEAAAVELAKQVPAPQTVS
jgi:hypothetical protein